MKPILVRLIAFLAALSLADSALAQSSSSNTNFKNKISNATAERYVAAEADLRSLTEMKALSPKLYSRFTRDFQTAYDITVYQGKNIQVNCKTDGDMNRATFTRKGRFLHNLKHYDYKKLPAKVSELINEAYPRYEIFGGVVEIDVMNQVAYFVLIETPKTWKRLKVLNGEIEVYEEYNKSADQSYE